MLSFKPNIEKMRARKDVQGLIKALDFKKDAKRYDKAIVRGAAAKALGELGDVHAVEPLIKALSDPQGYVRSSAAIGLGTLGDRRAVEPLIVVLASRDEYARRSYIKALNRLGDPRAVEPLIKVLHDDDETNRIEAIDALKEMGDIRVVGPLIKKLYIGGRVGQAAAEALKKMRFGITTESIIDALSDRRSINHSFRLLALDILGALKDTRAVLPLIRALGSGDRTVRIVAAEALRQLGEPTWADQIKGDQGDFARLARSGDLRSLEPLFEALKEDEDDVRKNAGEALGESGDLRAVEHLIKLLVDGNSSVRRIAAISLNKLGDATWTALVVGGLGDFNRIGMTGDARFVEP